MASSFPSSGGPESEMPRSDETFLYCFEPGTHQRCRQIRPNLFRARKAQSSHPGTAPIPLADTAMDEAGKAHAADSIPAQRYWRCANHPVRYSDNLYIHI